MSHRTIKDGVVGIINALGYAEASAIVSYKDVSAQEYNNTFIIQCIDGKQEPDSQTLADRAYDSQTWKLLFAYERSSQNDAINLEEIHVKKDAIIAAIDNPTNWRSFARTMMYDSWELETTDNYFLISLTIKITDVYTY
jgi:hypothetical protein